MPTPRSDTETAGIVMDTAYLPPFIIADTEETLWPDPVERTQVFLERLHSLIEDYHERQGAFPPTITALLPAPTDLRRLATDAWGTLIRYERQAADFTLISAGPDGVFNTGDDLFATRGYERPVIPRPAGRATEGVIRLYQLQLTLFWVRNGALPAHLDELQASGMHPYQGTRDEWGEPIAYTPMEKDIELRSSGPDRVLNTADDVVVRGLADAILEVAPALRCADDG